MLVVVIKAGYSQTYVLTFAVVSTGRELECVAEDCLMVALSDDFRVKKVQEDEQFLATKAFEVDCSQVMVIMQVLHFAFDDEKTGFDLSLSARNCCSFNLCVDIEPDGQLLSFNVTHVKQLSRLLFATESKHLLDEVMPDFEFVRGAKSF